MSRESNGHDAVNAATGYSEITDTAPASEIYGTIHRLGDPFQFRDSTTFHNFFDAEGNYDSSLRASDRKVRLYISAYADIHLAAGGQLIRMAHPAATSQFAPATRQPEEVWMSRPAAISHDAPATRHLEAFHSDGNLTVLQAHRDDGNIHHYFDGRGEHAFSHYRSRKFRPLSPHETTDLYRRRIEALQAQQRANGPPAAPAAGFQYPMDRTVSVAHAAPRGELGIFHLPGDGPTQSHAADGRPHYYQTQDGYYKTRLHGEIIPTRARFSAYNTSLPATADDSSVLSDESSSDGDIV
jgi:hypothetical protein